MSAAQHTPGPWEWDQGDAGIDYSAPYCSVTVDGGNIVIAEVNDRMSLETGQANARLIAAAPDMREALEMWHRALRGKAMSAEEQAAYNATRAALAKADTTTEGE